MKTIELEFVKNANQCGKMTFTRVKQGTNSAGRNVYIYKRTKMDGTFFSFEIFVPLVKKAGTYKLPTPKGQEQKWITYGEDFEEYPGASLFGRIAWEVQNIGWAEKKFNELTATAIEVPDTEDSNENENTPEAAEAESEAPKHRGRPKREMPPISLPDGEFSVKELAASNGVEYVVAYTFVKQEEGKTVIPTRTEQRASRGPKTQLYKKA